MQPDGSRETSKDEPWSEDEWSAEEALWAERMRASDPRNMTLSRRLYLAVQRTYIRIGVWAGFLAIRR
jgi:hypothetical protein